MTKAAIEPTPRVVRDKAFAKRMNDACDTHPHVPPYNYGRLTWLKDNMKSAHKIDISIETVRKWFAGESRPRPDKMRRLAMLLKVDEAWLSLGLTPEMAPDTRQAFNATAPGAVNVVAGFIQLGGGHPAFPNKNEDRKANLLAVINGHSHAFYVALGTLVEAEEPTYKFTFPVDIEKLTAIGTIQNGPLELEFLRMAGDDVASVAHHRGGFYELTVKKTENGYITKRQKWERLVDFRDALD